jgi:hypothetical protein
LSNLHNFVSLFICQSACQQFLLGGGEFFVRQNARVVQLDQLLKLGGQIGRGSLLDRGCILLWRWSILLLRIGYTLLVSLVVLLLRSRILLRIFLLLVVVYCTGSAGDDRCTYGNGSNASYRSSDHPSSHHFDLLDQSIRIIV